MHRPAILHSLYKTAIAATIIAVSFASTACKAKTSNATETIQEKPPQENLRFNGDSAFAAICRQVEFGPRKPGSEPHRITGEWIADQFRRHGLHVTLQETQTTTFDGVRIPMRNILASLDTANRRRILIVAHWDTRPWADQDPDPENRKKPVSGANDGASGVGVALELARALRDRKIPVGVDFLMVDAEDWGTDGDDQSWAMGARYFAANPPKNWKYPEAAVILDMVGDKNATFLREYFSQQAAPQLISRIWDTARNLGYSDIFIDRPGAPLTDDHIPFIEAGIPAIDIVDYREGPDSGFPPQWHTLSDTPELISTNTLEAVGKTIEKTLLDY